MKKLVLGMVMIFLAGCGGGGGGGGSTSTPVITAESNKAAYDKAVAPLNDVYARFKDAMAIAQVTPRIALATPITNMQNLKREADALVVPKCLTTAKTFLTTGMDAANSGYLDFMKQGTFYTFLLDQSQKAFTAYEEELPKQALSDFTIM